MAKLIAQKEYALINFEKNIFKRFKIEILSVGHNQFHIISTNGPITTKGRETMVRSTNIKEAYQLFDKQIFLKKQKGYENVEKLQEALLIGINVLKKEKKAKPPLPPASSPSPYACDECHKKMTNEEYEEINKWARGGGGWDNNKEFIGHQKVLCIDCQIEHAIYRKSFKRTKKSSPSASRKKG